MLNMKILIIAMVFMAVIWFAVIASNVDADTQTAAVVLSGLVIIWYVTKVIYFACKIRDKSSCSKQQTQRTL